jgi:hypothetical protein
VNLDLKPTSNMNPKTVSNMTIKIAIAKENGIKNGKFKTVSPKYSASL